MMVVPVFTEYLFFITFFFITNNKMGKQPTDRKIKVARNKLLKAQKKAREDVKILKMKIKKAKKEKKEVLKKQKAAQMKEDQLFKEMDMALQQQKKIDSAKSQMSEIDKLTTNMNTISLKTPLSRKERRMKMLRRVEYNKMMESIKKLKM